MDSDTPRVLSIAIDGPAGAGKSTTARMLATALKIVYVDSGAMYRAVAWTCQKAGIAPTDTDSVSEAAKRLDIRFAAEAEGAQKVYVDGVDVTAQIRTPEISQLASTVSAIPEVRESLVAKQRQLGSEGGVVMEGRDIGTVVLPDAELKIFLTASLDERARRRYAELEQKGTPDLDFAKVKADMAERDNRDSTRIISPLKAAPDSVTIDSDHLDAHQVVDRILTLYKNKGGVPGPVRRATAPIPTAAADPTADTGATEAAKSEAATTSTGDESSKASKKPLSDRTPETITPEFFFVRGAFRWFYIMMGGITITNAHYVPKTGPVIVAANHVSMADPPLTAAAINRPLRYMAKRELFEAPGMNRLSLQLGAFPVSRGTADRNAIRTALGVLANGEVLVVYPEGQRGDGVTFGEPEKGMAMIALKARVPIVPAYICGTEKLLPKGAKVPRRARLYIRFGPPIDTTPFQGKSGLDTLGPAVMEKIAELREEHRKATER